ncbi:hypothetical protein [Rhodococcus sp. IEGM 1330]|uniref:hypothetical protein n=1 Tax=Rhodococcus sp. IEGM 1330 TaxID=3082225 RepID=UPI0029548557|nr:hypothetical protein [Rhodococcus sp. IEGM 1330]MDV8023040.1 hypothetical protein [Rhodococcus sp. IEGM 1330]
MTFERIISGATLVCIALGLVLVFGIGEVAGWGLVAVGLGVGVVTLSARRRTSNH